MTGFPYRSALIIGAGTGISASVARMLAEAGCKIGLAARDAAKLRPLVEAIDGHAFSADASDPDAMQQLFARRTNVSVSPKW